MTTVSEPLTGAQRSVRYAQAATDDEGNIYVFSGQSANDDHVGALKIAKGSKEFDKSYHFNIGEKSGGYRFRKVYHIGGDDFLLECFPEKGAVENMTPPQNGRCEHEDQSFKWVSRLPGMMPLPSASVSPTIMTARFMFRSVEPAVCTAVVAAGGKPSGKATFATVIPTIYVIGADGVATPGMTFKDTELLKAITILK